MPNELIPSDVVKAIQESVPVDYHEINSVWYTNKPIYAVPDVPLPETIKIHTLTGIVNFINDIASVSDSDIQAIHIENATTVSVVGAVEGRERRRPVWVRAKHKESQNSFKFNCHLPAEDFIIGLQTGFVQNETTRNLLAILGNIKDENVRSFGDDGVSQSVVAKKGISMVGEVPVPNPIRLEPFRTFAEIDQPGSEYILRLKSGTEKPMIGLFETANPAWELVAIESIVEFFEKKLSGLTIIA